MQLEQFQQLVVDGRRLSEYDATANSNPAK